MYIYMQVPKHTVFKNRKSFWALSRLESKYGVSIECALNMHEVCRKYAYDM